MLMLNNIVKDATDLQLRQKDHVMVKSFPRVTKIWSSKNKFAIRTRFYVLHIELFI